MSRCRSCGAPIVWAKTSTGKSIPVDPDPDDRGNVELSVDDLGRYTAVVHPQLPLGAPPLHMPHHATCPDGDA